MLNRYKSSTTIFIVSVIYTAIYLDVAQKDASKEVWTNRALIIWVTWKNSIRILVGNFPNP